MKDTLFVNLDTTPLQEQMEEGHQKSEAHLEVIPNPMFQVFAVTDSGQERKDAFDQHTDIPGATLTGLHILRSASLAMKPCISTDDHLSLEGFQQRMKLSVRDIGGGRLPSHDQAPFIQDHAEFATTDQREFDLPFLPRR